MISELVRRNFPGRFEHNISSNTPGCKFIQVTLTSWIGCVWLGLRLNSAGRKISRNQIKDFCSKPILLCVFRQRYTNPHTHKACCHLQNPFRNMLLVRKTKIPALSSQLFLTKGYMYWFPKIQEMWKQTRPSHTSFSACECVKFRSENRLRERNI